eukprot:TRINITY_DN2201_c0_g2_i1.p1 TRINITY_DN2201_c0_g2~~TRINITY_DN2201_c0_g2_i1.p1  ORF type:complete len:299 (-),score=64.77 TRINITY_DN2201_c0_g2_i1:61-885(-)
MHAAQIFAVVAALSAWCFTGIEAAEGGSIPISKPKPAATGDAAASAEQEDEVDGSKTSEDVEAEIAEVVKDTERSSTGMVQEWEKHMEGFTPELLLTFPLPARTDEFFYEDVAAGAPVLIRGGFFAAASEATSTVEFSVTDPKGNIIVDKKDDEEGLFHFLADIPGTYTFIVSNHRWMEEKTVTFALGKGNETHLQPEHLTSLEDYLKTIDRTLVDIQTESTYLWIRQKSHMKTIESIHNRVLAFSVLEFLILVGVSGFQVYYIKGLLSDRRVL